MRLKEKVIKKYRESRLFIQFVINHFVEDDCTYRASALAFTTLIAIVPLMSVGFALFSIFPVFNTFANPIQDFIFDNFVPATGKIIQNYLQFFATQVFKLSVTGITFLFVTALLLMYTIEGSMNKIWRVSSPRKGVSAFLLYWAILSLAPFLLGLSVAASSYVISMPYLKGYKTPMLLTFTPILLSIIGFTFLYVIVPNCKVRLKYGIYGAMFATVFFEIAKQAFAYYLSRYNTYELLYGAFATIPIFFIWVYWVWLLTLLGAEITYAFSVHHQRREGSHIDGLLHALLWLKMLWTAHQQGNSVSLEELVNISEQPFEVDIGEMLRTLQRSGLIKVTEHENYILSQDLTNISLYEFVHLLPYPLPNMEELRASKAFLNRRWISQFIKTDTQLKKALAIDLESFFRNDKFL
jgi:membrane protein